MPLLNTITTPYAEAFLQVAESRNEVDEADNIKSPMLISSIPLLSSILSSTPSK